MKKLLCTECGAINIFEDSNMSDKCNYCGSILDMANFEVVQDDVKQAAMDATSFKSSLIAEINGQKASIADMWESLLSNSSIGEDKMIAFAILVPSTAKAQKKCNGRMLRGIFSLLKALNGKNEWLEMFLIGITRDYQKLGVPAIIMNHIIKTCIENGVKICESGPELETNESIQSMWKTFNTRQHKRRRCWIKEID